MGKILEALLTDQLRVDSVTERRSPEHQALCKKSGELHDQLAEMLNDRQKTVLTELEETNFEESCCCEQAKFERGFRLGALLIAEIFFEQNTVL